MKIVKILTFAICLTTAGWATAALINKKKADKKQVTNNTPAAKAEDKGFAVVELFTSEGCSSCPSADAVVAKIEKESAGRPIYILAYHVDYWNRLGWKDVFSSPEYSTRQNAYANWLNLSSIYTPQVVVNGKTEFVGSKEGTLRNTITANLSKTSTATLALSDLKTAGNKVKLNYTANGTGANSTVLLALIEKKATTNVKNGENGGRTLSHVQIVTNMQNIPLKGETGEATVTLPNNFSPQNYELIAFVQNARNGEITAATRMAFPSNFTASN